MASVGEHRSDGSPSPPAMPDGDATDDELPQCKIKRNYSCTMCSFFSQNPRSFLYHSRDVHFDKIKIYECSKCLYASKHSQKLQRHINMIHVPGRNPPKRVVPKRVVERKEVKPLPPIAPAPLPTPNMSEDVQDLGAVSGDVKMKCSVCSFTSRSTALITRHERVVHLKKRFLRCTKCSYVTHVKARFTKHVKYHSMPMIKCDLCDFRTPYKWNLDRHYKNHCGSGAFQCSKCNFRADIKQSLTVHEMNHHVPPVGAGAAILMRKKNKVGASETTALESDGIDQDELELLRLEREEEEEEEGEQVKVGELVGYSDVLMHDHARDKIFVWATADTAVVFIAVRTLFKTRQSSEKSRQGGCSRPAPSYHPFTLIYHMIKMSYIRAPYSSKLISAWISASLLYKVKL